MDCSSISCLRSRLYYKREIRRMDSVIVLFGIFSLWWETQDMRQKHKISKLEKVGVLRWRSRSWYLRDPGVGDVIFLQFRINLPLQNAMLPIYQMKPYPLQLK